ncbi:MSO1 [Candida oxycetoniae]|uniref:MSO1 n=1 Tax=Candida oxycetoniae TaxID=497107 RepID=A0AAI9X023_9ASCO|nr:MSO1 [Candida oxycetoniae]KAI3406803.2 MSO1 [Candida oxycetoniae]
MQHSNTGGGFFSKIKENYSTKFANLSLAGGNTEKDGSTPNDTLIHHAFVKYYESKGLAYPEWLGVKTFEQQNVQPQYGRSSSYSRIGNGQTSHQPHAYRSQTQSFQDSEFQPVKQDNLFNNSFSQRQFQQQQQSSPSSVSLSPSQTDASTGRLTAQRTSSRLQDLYNKSRQQSASAGYTSARYNR